MPARVHKDQRISTKTNPGAPFRFFSLPENCLYLPLNEHARATACATRFSTMTLCNLSTHEDCKATLVSSHGLPPLVEMLDGESDLVKRYAAMTLCNLSTLAANQVGRLSNAVRQMHYDYHCGYVEYLLFVRMLSAS